MDGTTPGKQSENPDVERAGTSPAPPHAVPKLTIRVDTPLSGRRIET
jgi:hypothetical protein